MSGNDLIILQQSNNQDLSQNKSKVTIEGFEYPLFGSSFQSLSPIRFYARVSDELLRKLYLRTSRIRECVDGIARVVANHFITIEVPQEYKTELKSKVLQQFLNKFFAQVNRKQETIRILIEKSVRDLLVHSRSFIEKVRNIKGELVELYVRDPLYITIQKDEHGVINSFIQYIHDKKVIFSTKDIIFLVFNSCSFDDYGLPIIEGILDEVASLILGTRTIANFILDDSVPPGILILGELGEEAYNRLKIMFTDPAEKNKLKVIRNIEPNQVNWLRLDRSISSETKIDYLLDRIDTIIFKAFQLPINTELKTKVGAEFTEKMNQSKLITPLVNLIEDKFTYEIFYKEFNLPIKLSLLPSNLTSQEYLDKARGLTLLLNSGALTINEVRKILGFPQINNGYIRLGKLGNEFIIFDEDTGMPKRIPDFIS